jgi:hypothetical protein
MGMPPTRCSGTGFKADAVVVDDLGMESNDVTPVNGRSPGFGLLCRALLGRIGRRQARSVAESYLLDATELPGGGWINSRQASLRSVWTPFRRPPPVRWVSASRNYRYGQPTRYLYIEIAVTEDEADAERLIENSRTRFYRNPSVSRIGERSVTGYELPAIDSALLYERETVRGSVHAVNRWVTGRVGEVFLAVQAGGSGGGWEWSEAVAFATAQADKIARLRTTDSSAP